ncbi:hypothetical protein SNOUR_29350 [Streptomyces noursei ATCC 11455]|nr:hypothetical protein SNOUR_29350 [Streptomyces noursei ATCC 11455]
MGSGVPAGSLAGFGGRAFPSFGVQGVSTFLTRQYIDAMSNTASLRPRSVASEHTPLKARNVAFDWADTPLH